MDIKEREKPSLFFVYGAFVYRLEISSLRVKNFLDGTKISRELFKINSLLIGKK